MSKILHNHRSLIDACHEAYWRFPDDSLSSDRRIAIIFAILADEMTSGQFSALSKKEICALLHDLAIKSGLVRLDQGIKKTE